MTTKKDEKIRAICLGLAIDGYNSPQESLADVAFKAEEEILSHISQIFSEVEQREETLYRKVSGGTGAVGMSLTNIHLEEVKAVSLLELKKIKGEW